MESSRINQDWSISLVRFVAMSFILLCHILQYYGNGLCWYFNVGVQMFFFLSGYCYGRRHDEEDPLRFYCRRLVRILVPCYVFLGAAVLLSVAFGGYHITARGLARIFALRGSDGITGIFHIWFVPCLLFCYFLLPLFGLMRKSFSRMSAGHFTTVALILSGMFCLLLKSYQSYFQPAWILCFIVGYYISWVKSQYGDWYVKRSTIIFACAGGAGLLIRIGVDLSGVRWDGYGVVLPYIRACGGIAVALILCQIKARDCHLLRISDRYSYEIYLVHQLFILGALSLMHVWRGIGAVLVIICGTIFVKVVSNAVLRLIRLERI